jgi:Ca2+-transporting ATPase
MKNEEENVSCFPATKILSTLPCFTVSPCISSITSAFISQLKEPLIIILLISAVVSLFIGEKADAISIGIALTIVSFVAAIQEYRSEEALQKLVDLVPHTCTVIRDGRAHEHFLAKDLVVGDLIVLGTGEYVVCFLIIFY